MVPGAYRAGRIKRMRPGEELCNVVLVLLTERHALLCHRCAHLHDSQRAHPNSDRVRLNARARVRVLCFELCCLGDDADWARATISGLELGARYRFRLRQLSRPEETFGGQWKNQMYVNRERYDTRMGEDVDAYGYATAAEQGTVEFLFVDTNEDLRLGLSWFSLARVCGCTSDKECPGGDLCEGMEVGCLVGDSHRKVELNGSHVYN